MAQSTSVINACDVALWLDSAAGTPTDISGSSNQVKLNFDNELGEYLTFGAKWRRRIECGKDAAFDLTVFYSTAADEAFDLLKDWFFATDPGDRTLAVYFPDKNVGSDKYSGEFKLESLSWDAEAGKADPIAVEASLKPNGAVAHTQVAT